MCEIRPRGEEEMGEWRVTTTMASGVAVDKSEPQWWRCCVDKLQQFRCCFQMCYVVSGPPLLCSDVLCGKWTTAVAFRCVMW